MTTSTSKLLEIVVITLLSTGNLAIAEEPRYEVDGHLKARALADTFPGDSIFNDLIGSTSLDVETDVRLNLSVDQGSWSFDATWQLIAGHGDRVDLSRLIPANGLSIIDSSISDDRRLMNLTDMIRDEGSARILHRLDRLAVGYASEKLIVRVGRQAMSWGNGLIFSPMDIVNPFDPTVVDTEYKAGDDMIYGQYLTANGNDIQAAHVFRRDPLSGNPDTESATSAIKYHGILGSGEIDLLIAESYGESIVGFGGNKSIGGALWRGDVVVTDTGEGNTVQLVTNLSYSWVRAGRNMSGVIEYYYNGFGQSSDRYDLPSLAQNPDLIRRLARGDVFTIGRNYLAGGVLVEMSPLWSLTPNLFVNLDDTSALLQLTTRRSLSDNSDFLAALNVPLGSSGTEFGGVSTGQGNTYFSTSLSLFAQFAWYF